MLILMFIDGVILHSEKRSFEHFEISFLEKTVYFAYLLTKRENLSHSEAKLICWFSLCMKWPIWSHPFSKFENKYITSFLYPFPGPVTHFTSFEELRGRGY